MGQKQREPFWGFWCTTHFRTHVSGDWDVHWRYGMLTHGHMISDQLACDASILGIG